jgi:hypothetical protein
MCFWEWTLQLFSRLNKHFAPNHHFASIIGYFLFISRLIMQICCGHVNHGVIILYHIGHFERK